MSQTPRSNNRAVTASSLHVGQYVPDAALFRPYDPAAPAAASFLIDAIGGAAPWLHIEHIGSTAVPDCGGKGIVDLMALYPPGGLAAAREAIDRLGFQPQRAGRPFPEDRPMRVGTVSFGDQCFRVHVHIIADAVDEVSDIRHFRDALIAEGELRLAYEAKKRDIIAGGVKSTAEYTEAKTAFITGVIAEYRKRLRKS